MEKDLFPSHGSELPLADRMPRMEQNRNLFVVSVILITGIGGLSVSFGKVTLTTIACALILGILANVMLGVKDKKKDEEAPASEDNTYEL